MSHAFSVPRFPWLGFVVFATLLAPSAHSAPRTGAGAIVYYNGAVFTGQDGAVDGSWFVVRDGRFVEVGRGAGLPVGWRGAETHDLGGRFVAPGFIDAHVHLVDGGLGLIQTDLGLVLTAEELSSALAQADHQRVGGFVVARNLGLEACGGTLPTHDLFDRLLPSPDVPAFVALKGGHLVYLSRPALARLGIDRDTPDPPGGRIVRDSAGEPTGVLVDQAAWNAVRFVSSAIDPQTVAQAILAAQQRALRYGITTIGDNTFYPLHMAQFLRLSEAGLLKLRVAARSFGSLPITHFLMKSIGSTPFGRDPRVRYLGAKFFLDTSLSDAADEVATWQLPGGAKRDAGEAGLTLTKDQLREAFLFAGPYGLAFHNQSRAGTERLLAVRASIAGRRDPRAVDIIDHCGACDGDLPARLRDSGFKVTLLPGQLHDLPIIARRLGDNATRRLLPIRALFQAGVRPALTSDWPYGTETTYPGVPDCFHRLGLAPLANLAVVTSGLSPDGTPIPGAGERTISPSQALLGYTAYAAPVVGRPEEIGKIAPSFQADFVVLPRSPLDEPPAGLYTMEVQETYVGGEKVWGAADEKPAGEHLAREAATFRRTPLGYTLSPIIGYDPVPGVLLGGAVFFYPYQPRGPRGLAQVMIPPSQGTVAAQVDAAFLHALGPVSPRMFASVDSLRGRYFGFGMATPADAVLTTRPVRVDGALGAMIALGDNLQLGTYGVYTYLRDRQAAGIDAASGGAEGAINGHATGARLELVHDDRDNEFSTRRGGRETLWTEAWLLQAGQDNARGRAGASVARFFALYAPDLVLATHLEGAASMGRRAYATSFSLGGADLLRGYLANRFRGDAFVAATLELRFPIWGFVSGVAFADAGRVFRYGDESDLHARALGLAGGGGLRIGLPPDWLIKLRFDVGFSRDQWGLFFKFNEAF